MPKNLSIVRSLKYLVALNWHEVDDQHVLRDEWVDDLEGQVSARLCQVLQLHGVPVVLLEGGHLQGERHDGRHHGREHAEEGAELLYVLEALLPMPQYRPPIMNLKKHDVKWNKY